MKTMVLFWLLGATDGHAKNFSLFLSPGGRFRMTPLYDAISAQPSVDAREIRQDKFRLAMAVGDHRRYRINTIMPHHFLQTAQRASMGEQIMTSVFEELRDTTHDVVRNAIAELPQGFPEVVTTAIRSGINTRLSYLLI